MNDRLKTILKCKRITGLRIAKVIGCRPSTVSQWLSFREISPEKEKLILEAVKQIEAEDSEELEKIMMQD